MKEGLYEERKKGRIEGKTFDRGLPVSKGEFEAREIVIGSALKEIRKERKGRKKRRRKKGVKEGEREVGGRKALVVTSRSSCARGSSPHILFLFVVCCLLLMSCCLCFVCLFLNKTNQDQYHVFVQCCYKMEK